LKRLHLVGFSLHLSKSLSIEGCQFLVFIIFTTIYLEQAGESIKLDNGISSGSVALSLLTKGGRSVGLFDGFKESSGGFLLGRGTGKTTYGSTGLVHVTGKFVLYVVPFLSGDVLRKLSKTNLSFGKNSLFSVSIGWGILFIKGCFSCLSVYRVRGVNLTRLVTSVSSSLRVRGSVSKKTENRETGRFSYSSVGGGSWYENGGSSSDGLTTRGGLKGSGGSGSVYL